MKTRNFFNEGRLTESELLQTQDQNHVVDIFFGDVDDDETSNIFNPEFCPEGCNNPGLWSRFE